MILSRGKAAEALEWTRGVLKRLELTLNEKKTSVRNAREERFDFLGYTFGPHYSPRTGREYLGHSPSKKSVSRIKTKVGELLVPGNMDPWEKVCERLGVKFPGPTRPRGVIPRAYSPRGASARARDSLDGLD